MASISFAPGINPKGVPMPDTEAGLSPSLLTIPDRAGPEGGDEGEGAGE